MYVSAHIKFNFKIGRKKNAIKSIESQASERKPSHTLRPSQYLLMQLMQKLWPQGVDDGFQNTSRQMGHWNCLSDRKLPLSAILWKVRERERETGR